MKTIIKSKDLFFFLLVCFFICCKSGNKKQEGNVKDSSGNIIELKEVSGVNYHYNILYIKNDLCEYQDTILKTPIDEVNFHHFEILREDNFNTLFYEYSSVRPMFYKTIYFNKNNTKIDSLKKGSFNIETSDFNSTSLKIDKSICEDKIEELNFEN